MAKWFPYGKEGVDKTYAAVSKEQCELEHGHLCLDIEGVDLDTHDLVDGAFVLNAEKLAVKTASILQVSKIQDRTAARIFCLSIIDEIAAINKDLSDPTLMQTIFSSPGYQAIILSLLTGATTTAKDLIVLSGPALYPQATVDALVAKMAAYIATEA